jgi:hypothetical protein
LLERGESILGGRDDEELMRLVRIGIDKVERRACLGILGGLSPMLARMGGTAAVRECAELDGGTGWQLTPNRLVAAAKDSTSKLRPGALYSNLRSAEEYRIGADRGRVPRAFPQLAFRG